MRGHPFWHDPPNMPEGDAIHSQDYRALETMADFIRPRGRGSEQAHLEGAHHEIRTALTVLRSNVALMRAHAGDEAPGADRAVADSLGEMDAAVDRLQRLAVVIHGWHDEGAASVLRDRTRANGRATTSLLP